MLYVLRSLLYLFNNVKIFFLFFIIEVKIVLFFFIKLPIINIRLL